MAREPRVSRLPTVRDPACARTETVSATTLSTRALSHNCDLSDIRNAFLSVTRTPVSGERVRHDEAPQEHPEGPRGKHGVNSNA